MTYFEKLKSFSLSGFLFSRVVKIDRWLNKKCVNFPLSLELREKMVADILSDKITKISIIITTHNRLSALRDYALSSLNRLKFDRCPYEIIIVDNDSTDGTFAFLTGYSQTEPSVKICREEKRSISAGRNRGIKIATGELLVFIDDDCEVDVDWLNRLYHCHTEKNYLLGQGQIYDLILGKNLVNQRPLRETVAGGNLSIRKKVFDYVSFNEEIYFSHDDTDLIQQLETLWPDFPYFIDPTPIKHHRAPAPYRENDGTYNQESISRSGQMYNLAGISELTLKRNLRAIRSGLAWRFWSKEIIFLILESILYPQAKLTTIPKTKRKIYHQLIVLRKFSQDRYVSFTFDDGLINSAEKISKIISPHKATFYLVTGWLKPNPLPITDPPNINPDHGNFNDWQKLADLGHEIGSHTVSHTRADNPQAKREYRESLDFIKQFQPGPYSLAMPNSIEPITSPPYDSVRIGDGKRIYNSLSDINFARLISWDPVENKLSLKETLKKISLVPPESWLILRAHGLGNEGYCPWPDNYLREIYNFLRKGGWQIKTVREMTNDFGPLGDKLQ